MWQPYVFVFGNHFFIIFAKNYHRFNMKTKLLALMLLFPLFTMGQQLQTSECPAPEHFKGEYFWDNHEFGARLVWDKADYTFTLDRFEIYRSSNGVDFKLIKRIVNTPSITHYEAMDILEETGNFTYRIVAFYQDDCASDPIDLMINVTGIDVPVANDVTLYPNPTTGKITITAEQLRQVIIMNSLGQTLNSIDAGHNLIQIDLSSFGKGLYLLMIQTENGVARQSVIVK